MTTGKSSVAGIIDANGHLRVIISDGCLICHLASMKERLYVVPGLLVQEPVHFSKYPEIVKMVEDYIKQVT